MTFQLSRTSGLAATVLLVCVNIIRQPAGAATREEVYAPIRMEAGTSDADVTFYADDKPNGKAKGVQVNTLLANGHWITNEFKIAAQEKLPA